MGMMGAASEAGKGFDWQVTKRLLSYLKPYRRNLVIAVSAMLFTVAAAIIGPRLIGIAVERGVQDGNIALIGVAVFGYLLGEGLGLLGFRIQIANMAVAGQRVIQKLRDELFSHIQYLSMSFFSTYETGRIIARVIGDVNVLRETLTWAVVGTMRDILILVGVLISMVLLNLPLTGVMLVVIVALVTVANFWRIYARKAYIATREANAKVNAELSEAFHGVRVTQAFSRERFNYQRFTDKLNHDLRQTNMKTALIAGLFFPSIELIGGAAIGALIVVGGTLALQGQLSVAVLITFVLYVDQIFFPIRMLAQRYNMFQAVMAAGDKIFTLMDTPIEIKDAPGAVDLPRIRGEVRFEQVDFRYTSGDNASDTDLVLNGINLHVPAGATVAFVGHTGAGKSSMIKLIMRFHDVTGGRLTIDGLDVRGVTQRSLRSQIGVVLQETHLFAGTVMDNIRYGRLEATDAQVIEAATAVGAHDFISKLEHGYQTEIKEGGALLSAGQKQLLSFARALLADPRLLILDEATASIDTQTEKQIQAALKRLLTGRTSFVIAHRLSTITSADLIVVMEHGRIIEQGTHQDLLALGGVYHNLYAMAYARPLTGEVSERESVR
jgi:ATP-binding cassette subfamily B protein/subfamily B ATP-binding cassette protein MsbA